jgi:hypothetical protein
MSGTKIPPKEHIRMSSNTFMVRARKVAKENEKFRGYLDECRCFDTMISGNFAIPKDRVREWSDQLGVALERIEAVLFEMAKMLATDKDEIVAIRNWIDTNIREIVRVVEGDLRGR